MAARAAKSADLLRELLARAATLRAVLVRLPLVPPSVTLLTAAGPYAERIAEAEALMRADPRIANASVAGGFVFSDLPKCGMTVTVTARGGDAALARGDGAAVGAARLGRAAAACGAADAAGRCRGPGGRGRPGRGAAGAARRCRRQSRRRRPRQHGVSAAGAACGRGPQGVVLGVFVDPDLAAEAHGLGRGCGVRGGVQPRAVGKFSQGFAAPARILALRDGAGVGRRGTMAGRRFNLGPSALLEIGGLRAARRGRLSAPAAA